MNSDFNMWYTCRIVHSNFNNTYFNTLKSNYFVDDGVISQNCNQSLLRINKFVNTWLDLEVRSTNLPIKVASHNKCFQHKNYYFICARITLFIQCWLVRKLYLTPSFRQYHFVISFESRILLRLPRIQGSNKRYLTNIRITALLYEAVHLIESNQTLTAKVSF